MGYVHAQPTLPPSSRGRVDWLACLAFLDHRSHCTFWHWRIGQLHKIVMSVSLRGAHCRGVSLILSAASIEAAHSNGTGPASFFMASYHLCGTWVSLSARVTVWGDKYRIHRQIVFRHQLSYGLQPPSDQHLAGCLGVHPGLACQRVRYPVVYA